MADLKTRSAETRQVLSQEIKTLKALCIEACHIIANNSPMELHSITTENAMEKAIFYIESIRTNIENSVTPIIPDIILHSSQFLTELTEKTIHVEELKAFTKGAISDVDNEINRLQNLIKIVQKAKFKPRPQKREVTQDHILKAKQQFHTMKNDLHGLIHSLFSNNAEAIAQLLGELMCARIDENSNGYLPIRSENVKLIELLKDMKLVSVNPYNNNEIRLAY